MRARVINGNDPVESYLALQEEIEYIRKTGKPSFIESKVSRLHGHSSATGANAEANEVDPVKEFEESLLKAGILKPAEAKRIWSEFEEEGVKAQEQVRSEPQPKAESVWENVFVNSENADWRKF
jgi:2-oxoisovalerate dehydrogenase E1 component alpha subunit